MEMKSPSCPPSAADKDFQILITPWALSFDQAVRAVSGPDHGALVLFAGTVRNTEDDSKITSIFYEAYEAMAVQEIRKILIEARGRWNVRLAVQHRVGKVWAGEPSFVVAASGKHRPETFEACRHVVDRIKSDVPLWKVDFEKAL
jgi:molybdopterin synthase catalytic subunit